MQVLLIGSGGREHALAWKIAQSKRLTRLFAAPGNPGIGECAEIVALDPTDHAAIIEFCRSKQVDLVVVGPEAPLVAGLVDDLAEAGIAAFGPNAAAARLEGSKAFTKDLCAEAGIPTAQYSQFDNADEAKAYVRARGAPIVIKADGLAAGKGVTVASNLDDALTAIDACFSGAFGAAGASVVVEDYLEGEEASFFALSDGDTVLPLLAAQDHKRVGDGDSGPNTGGMGAFSPTPSMTPALIEQTLDKIIHPTITTMASRGTPFKGVLFAGLMLTPTGPQLIEYNVRFGDPETQAMMMRLESDLLELLIATAEGRLHTVSPKWSDDCALTVVMASQGYPAAYRKGSEIKGLEDLEALENIKIFHAGTATSESRLVSAGGRVLNITARGRSIDEARKRAYETIGRIDWPEGFYRSDIGQRAIERQ